MLMMILLFASIIFESTITTVPLALTVLTVYVILNKQTRFFYAGFAGGIILDSLTVRVLGSSSAFFVIWLYLILLYDRKYEIRTLMFVFVSIFFGSVIFLYLFKYNYIFLNALAGSATGMVLFLVLKRFEHNKSQGF